MMRRSSQRAVEDIRVRPINRGFPTLPYDEIIRLAREAEQKRQADAAIEEKKRAGAAKREERKRRREIDNANDNIHYELKIPILRYRGRIGGYDSYSYTPEYVQEMMQDIKLEDRSLRWNGNIAQTVQEFIDKIAPTDRKRLTPIRGQEYSLTFVLLMQKETRGIISKRYSTIPSSGVIYIADGRYDLYTILYTAISAFLDRSSEYTNIYYVASGLWIPVAISGVNLTPLNRITGYDSKEWKTPIHRQRMGGTHLAYKILVKNHIQDASRVRNVTGLCVIDAIWNTIVKHNSNPNSRMRKVTRNQIINEFAALLRKDTDVKSYGMISPPSSDIVSHDRILDNSSTEAGRLENDIMLIRMYGISLKNIVDWAKVNHFAIHALDYSGTLIERYVDSSDHHHATISFVVNNNHLYEIPDEELALKITKSNHIDLCETQCAIKYAAGDYAVLDEKTKYNISKVEHSVAVITDLEDLSPLLADAIKETGDVSCYIKVGKNNQITAFRHPANNKIVVSAPNYHLNKALCDYFFKTYNFTNLEWANQSTTKISTTAFAAMGYVMPESHYPPTLQRIINESPNLKPYITGNMPIKSFKPEPGFEPIVVGIDTRRAYTSFFLTMMTEFCRYLGFEDVERFDKNKHARTDSNGGIHLKAGFYHVTRATTMCNGTIHIEADTYPHNYVEFVLTRGEITYADVSHVLRPIHDVDAKHFAGYIQKVYDLEQKGLIPSSKELCNSLWGFMGTKQSVSTRATVTDSEAAAIDIFSHELHVHKRCPFIYTVNQMHFVHSSMITKLKTGCAPIHYQILVQGWIQLILMHDRFAKYGQVLGYHTDCMKLLVTSRKMYDELKREIAATAFCPLGKHFRIDKEQLYSDYMKSAKTPLETPPQDVDVNVYVPFPYTMPDWTEYPISKLETDEKCVTREHLFGIPTKSLFVTGPPGCGKSTLFAMIVALLIKANKKFICRSFQHIVKSVMEDKLIKSGIDINALGMGAPEILNSAMNVGRRGYERVRSEFAKAEYILIDEITAVPKAFLRLIDRVISPNQILICFGDINQCKSIEASDEDPTTYYYDQVPLFKRLCGFNIYHKQYIPGCMRFDAEMLKQVMEFLHTRTIRARKPIAVDVKKRIAQVITSINTDRHANNKESLDKAMLEENSRNIITLNRRAAFMNDIHNKSYPDTVDTTQYVRNMPLICYKNPEIETEVENKDMPIVHNADRFILLGKGEKGLLMENIITHKIIDLPTTEVLNRMDYGYSMTSHKVQGSEITGEYIIQNPTKMTFEMFYVAFTRATLASNVYYELEEDYTFPERMPNTYKTVRFTPTELDCQMIYKLHTPESPQQMYISMCKRPLNKELEDYKNKKTKTGKNVTEFIAKYQKSLCITAIATYCATNDSQMKRHTFAAIQDNSVKYQLLNTRHVAYAPVEQKEQKTKVTISTASYQPYITKSKPQQDTTKHRFRVCNKGTRTDFTYGSGASTARIEEYRAKAQEFCDKLYRDQGGI